MHKLTFVTLEMLSDMELRHLNKEVLESIVNSVGNFLKRFKTIDISTQIVEIFYLKMAIKQTIAGNASWNAKNLAIMIKNRNFSLDVTITAVEAINQTWVQLNKTQRRSVEQICDECVKGGQYNIAKCLIKKFVNPYETFSNTKSDAEIVSYLSSASGIELMELLHKYRAHQHLDIESHIILFQNFWNKALSNMAVLMNNFECMNNISQKL
eukprot:53746_1